jgi:hypothetical protein
MTGVSASGRARPARELAGVLAGGATGAGVVLLASRQGLARVIVRPPRPLPATVTALSAQDLRPAIAALAVAALASLTGLITIALGAGIALLAAGKVTPAAALAAAGRSGASPASGSGAGTAAGSVTAGTGGGTVSSLAGFGSHVVLEGSAWRALMVAGAALVIAAGLIVGVRARRLPAMSGRYERSARPAAAGGTTSQDGPDGSSNPADHNGPSGRTGSSRNHPGPASMWESLSAGTDPTAWPE